LDNEFPPEGGVKAFQHVHTKHEPGIISVNVITATQSTRIEYVNQDNYERFKRGAPYDPIYEFNTKFLVNVRDSSTGQNYYYIARGENVNVSFTGGEFWLPYLSFEKTYPFPALAPASFQKFPVVKNCSLVTYDPTLKPGEYVIKELVPKSMAQKTVMVVQYIATTNGPVELLWLDEKNLERFKQGRSYSAEHKKQISDTYTKEEFFAYKPLFSVITSKSRETRVKVAHGYWFSP